MIVKSGTNTGPRQLGHRRAYIPDVVFGQSWIFIYSGNSYWTTTVFKALRNTHGMYCCSSWWDFIKLFEPLKLYVIIVEN